MITVKWCLIDKILPKGTSLKKVDNHCYRLLPVVFEPVRAGASVGYKQHNWMDDATIADRGVTMSESIYRCHRASDEKCRVDEHVQTLAEKLADMEATLRTNELLTQNREEDLRQKVDRCVLCSCREDSRSDVIRCIAEYVK